jgi:predicted glycoside hydrolase/deacetylase ChbG (UPF0249 family)
MVKQVIINADDLGLSLGTNKAIATAADQGILTSASLMANAAGYEDAVKNIIPQRPDLGIGIHLSLTDNKSTLDQTSIPLLVNKQKFFKHSFFDLFNLTYFSRRQDLLVQIEMEAEAQVRKIISAGIKIDHIDGHRHVHMIPPIFDIILALAKKYAISTIRLSHEAMLRYVKPNFPSYGLKPILNGNIFKKLLLSSFAKINKKNNRCKNN